MVTLQSLAKILYRNSAGSSTDNKIFSNGKERKVLSLIFILLGLLLVPLIWSLNEDRKITPFIELKPSDWTSYFPENVYDNCDLNIINDQKCIAHPDNSTIWNSKIKRLSKEYFKKANVINSNFWVSTVIKEDTLNAARAHFANYLILHQLEGSYDIWMDGSLVGRGNYQNNDYPMVFPISMERLSGKPLYVAINIKRDIYTTNVESNDFETQKDGFYTDLKFESVLRWQAASRQTGHLVLAALYIFLALFFYVITTNYQSQGPEYGPATGLAGCLALFHLMYVDAMYRFISADLWYSLLAGIFIAIPVYVLKFAVSYSRSKFGIEKILFYLLITSFLSIFMFLNNPEITDSLINKTAKYGIPSSYLIGAFLLYLQFNFLARTEKDGISARRENLLFMSTMYCLGAVVTFLQYQTVHDITLEIPSGLWINIIFLFFLAIKTGKEIRSHVDISLKAPVSAFHRRTTLPKQIEGSILMIDLKNSEGLFRQGAEKNRAGSIMSLILSNLWSFFKKEGLIILQGEGDSIIALWEKDKNDSPEKILRTIMDLEIFMQDMSENLIDNGVQLDSSICFRAAIVEGAVKPIWREIEKDKIPAWIEAGGKNVFVDAARLLAIEKEIVPESNRSSLIVMGDLAEKYQGLTPHFTKQWDIHKVDCVSKHGKTYNISIFNPFRENNTAKIQAG